MNDLRRRLGDKRFAMPAAELRDIVIDARERTLALIEDLDDTQLEPPLLETVNPLLWELGHVAFFYEAFILRLLDGAAPIEVGGEHLYDSFRIEHDARWSAPLPSRAHTLEYMRRVLDGCIERLEKHDPDPIETYLYLLAVLHEDMHGEAFTYMRQTLEYAAPAFALGGETTENGEALEGDAEIPGGIFLLGSPPETPFVFDNEKWAHPVEVAPFRIARSPVTAAEFAEFVDAGGYDRRELWSPQGWRWRARGGVRHPVSWHRGEAGWLERRFDRLVPLPLHAPVIGVNWYEAEAYCAWRGRRLPAEVEWEIAAGGEPDGAGRLAEAKRVYPWGDEAPGAGRACLDARTLERPAAGALAEGDSAFGCRQMLGNVWEWTADAFYPFPGYVVDFPYREYSAPWFGYRKVLKGGSWATRSRLARIGYRNFFLPHRRDVFAGFRTCALETS